MQKRSLTLIEVLAALSLFSLVIGVGFFGYFGLTARSRSLHKSIILAQDVIRAQNLLQQTAGWAEKQQSFSCDPDNIEGEIHFFLKDRIEIDAALFGDLYGRIYLENKKLLIELWQKGQRTGYTKTMELIDQIDEMDLYRCSPLSENKDDVWEKTSSIIVKDPVGLCRLDCKRNGKTYPLYISFQKGDIVIEEGR